LLDLDVSQALAKAITPSYGIPDQELSALRTSMRRYVQEWLSEREHGEHQWAMNPYDREAAQVVQEVAMWASAERIRTVVWVGIGGSGLGPKVIQEVFETPETLEFILLDSIDPAFVQTILAIVDWRSTLLVVASKSGGTLEPLSLFFTCYEKLHAARGDKAPQYAFAITDPFGGPLRSFCLDEGIRMLPLPSKVGGRYSIFTPIGLLPLALLSGQIESFLRGAKEMDTLCQSTSLDENPAALLASVQYLLDMKRGYTVRVVMPYSQRLAPIARWNQQLIAESLGKTETKNPIPMAAVGTQDQHSHLQQWMAGPRSQWHLFIREDEKPRVYLPEKLPSSFSPLAGKTFSQLLDACYAGTSTALTSVKRPHVTITLPRLDERHLGQLFFLLLAEAVFLGKLYRLDPYGQPAVEIGKKITREILSKGRSEE
jgi:glucose-6-phosphate isomerase